jgi:hypothetical protein
MKFFAPTCALPGAWVKSCAMLMVLALSIASQSVVKAAVTESADQPQPKPSTDQTKAVATRQPTVVELENWREAMIKTPEPKKGCFTATYPETAWTEVACKKPSHKRYPPPTRGSRNGIQPQQVGGTVGTSTNTDFSAKVTGHISVAEGSFDSVTGVTSECNIQCNTPMELCTDTCPANLTCSSQDTPDDYSLQLNTKPFDTSTCDGAPAPGTWGKCQGFQQFVYDPNPFSGEGGGAIQYWLDPWGPQGSTCPPGWTDGSYPVCATDPNPPVFCYTTATLGMPAAEGVPAKSLQEMKVAGTAPNVIDVNDHLTIFVGITAYKMTGDSVFPDLAKQWQEVEFNVFGESVSQAVFNKGTLIKVRVGADSGTTGPPICDQSTFTGESNNLTLVNTAPSALPGSMPAVVFSESYPAPAGAPATCADATTIGDTHLTTFGGLYYDFQASGEFVLAQNGSDFIVQTRQATGPPQYPNTAVNKAVAVQMGNSRVAIYIEPTRLVIDGSANDLADGKTVLLSTGVQVARFGNEYIVADNNGNHVTASLQSEWINVTVGLGSAPQSGISGLLGSPNANSLETRSGVVLNEPVSFTDLYQAYGDSWRVAAKDSLFTEETTIKPGNPDKPFFATDLAPAQSAHALAVCKAAGITVQDLLDSCVLDTTVMNDDTAVNAFVLARLPLHVIKPVLPLTPLPQ